jgi:hypothetical protein
MDIDKFTEIATDIFTTVEDVYTLDETLNVFIFYFECYAQHTGHSHPPIKAEQIKRIMWCMPWLCEDCSMEIEPYEYPYIIRQHFQTKYRNCDFNINHFFSGRIRYLRYCETIF